jgi:DNA-binding CsgD family transcriptional regulator
MEQRSLLTMDELLEYVNNFTSDVDAIYQHYHSGTIDELYHTTVETVVDALMMIPINRLAHELEPTEENAIVSSTMEKIAGLIATMCSKSEHTVRTDILQATEKFPASDVREATILRHANRLN